MHKTRSIVMSIILFLVCIGCVFERSSVSGNIASENQLSFKYDCSGTIKNVALIFPGMGQRITRPEYLVIGGYYKQKGITPVYADVDWNKININDLNKSTDLALTEIERLFPDSDIYLFGFSFGAVITYKLSLKIMPIQTILCSMSPVFEEDMRYQIFPFRQLTGVFYDYTKNGLSYSNNDGRRFVLLYGDHDSILINKSIIEHRKEDFKYNTTIIVKDAGHDISGQSYLKAIKESITGGL